MQADLFGLNGISWTHLLAMLCAGVIIGILHFGGLWLTVRYLPRSRNPALLAAFSSLGRLILCLAAFLGLANGRWEDFAMLLLGLVAARTLLVRRLSGLSRGGSPRPSVIEGPPA